MGLSGGKNVRSVEGPMGLQILWVYEGIFLADLSSVKSNVTRQGIEP